VLRKRLSHTGGDSTDLQMSSLIVPSRLSVSIVFIKLYGFQGVVGAMHDIDNRPEDLDILRKISTSLPKCPRGMPLDQLFEFVKWTVCPGSSGSNLSTGLLGGSRA
jgi:hypothetical protein